MDRPFFPSVTPPAGYFGPAWWFVFRGAELLLYRDSEAISAVPLLIELSAISISPARSHFLGFRRDVPSYAIDVDAATVPPGGLDFQNLRTLHGRVEDDLFALAGRAAQVIEWDRTHLFCGRCGTPTQISATERAKICPACGYTAYPRLSPAVITLVERDDEVLLARGPNTPPGRYALIAGFVEPGESLEETVQREIREEVGIDVDRIHYFGSQPWPFPHQVMLGFTAQYAGGAIDTDGVEIEDARWFRAAALPNVPPKLSIARRLIDAYAAKNGVVIEQP